MKGVRAAMVSRVGKIFDGNSTDKKDPKKPNTTINYKKMAMGGSKHTENSKKRKKIQ